MHITKELKEKFKDCKIIGIHAPAAGSGKSTVADKLGSLELHDAICWRLSLARPIKDMLSELFGRKIEDADKEAPYFMGSSPRRMMQTLGTEWGRTLHPDFWLGIWVRRALHCMKWANYRHIFIVDDVRFPNEAQLIKDLGGALIRVMRPDNINTSTHSSEGQVLPYDYEIVNDGTLDELSEKVKTIAEKL